MDFSYSWRSVAHLSTTTGVKRQQPLKQSHIFSPSPPSAPQGAHQSFTTMAG